MDVAVKSRMAALTPVTKAAQADTVKSTAGKMFGKFLPYLMIAPAMVTSIVFLVFPILYMFYLSFFKWNMIGEMKFIGLDNYLSLISDL